MIHVFRKSFGEWGYPNKGNSQMTPGSCPREVSSLLESGKTGYDYLSKLNDSGRKWHETPPHPWRRPFRKD